MNTELLSVLDHIEREKGISREVLIQAVEAALISAAKKSLSAKTPEEIKVSIDRETGNIHVFSDGKEVTSLEFGRIAAQTAKQVIIQKIREAERDVIYNDFQDRIGSIASGVIQRFERGNIIVDLGKTEAMLPKREQSPREEYKQGQRIRAFILEVKKTPRGPQIILSRTHSGLLKKLFELEVPEIYEGIVEIKSVAREPGDRSKVAVFSKDEKVDCVGACVGMRGSRVKNIVKELQGEKIDIIRYSEDMQEYITAALSPAKLKKVTLDKKQQKAKVIVEDDQLSLTIGKKGKNVRLACRLTKWDIDIRSHKEAMLEKSSIKDLPGIGPKTKEALVKAGFETIEALDKKSIEELIKVPGIGKKKAEKINLATKEFLKNISRKKEVAQPKEKKKGTEALKPALKKKAQ